MLEKPEEQVQRQLVVAGASAGGVEALITLVGTLPRDFPAPVVIAQHLDPNRTSQLGTILERHTSLRVVTVEKQVALEDGTIYVVPADHHVQITDNDITISWDGDRRPKPSIDRVLRSAAEIYGERLIAVILTGMGSDGQAGAQEVKKHGGTVIIQDPATAAYPSMPRSLSPTIVDMSVPIERIGPLLYDLLTNALVPERDSPETAEQAEQLFGGFLQQVRDVSGIDFGSYKRGTIQRRIQRRMAMVGATTLSDYIAYVNRHDTEYQRLVSSFLIKVTEFVRDQELFDTLEQDILPALVDRARQSQSKELRIWSAGCATGEEPYSLAILVSEVLGDTFDSLDIKIFATDLDTDAIAFARRGHYPAASLANLPPRLRKRYFIEHEDGYEVSRTIRGPVVFGEHDLSQRAPFPRIDMVVCRNVLIYFTRELQQRTLRLFAFSLRTGGYLVLGKSETITPFPDSFVSEYAQVKIFRRQGERLLIPPPLGNENTPDAVSRRAWVQRNHRNLTSELSRIQQELQLAHRTSDNLLLKLPIGVIVVDQRYDIQEINSAARRLLSIYQNAIGEDVVHLAANLPPRILRAAIDRTVLEQETVILEEVPMEDVQAGEQVFLQISCYPQIHEDKEKVDAYVLLLVQDVTRTVQNRKQVQTERDQQQALTEQLQQQITELTQRNTNLNIKVTQLQQQLETLEQAHAQSEKALEQQKEQIVRLQQVNQELVQANEDLSNTNQQLRIMNDEFLMTSEEAQASTEEIETLSEETQATNEELETLNEEFQGTIEELTTTVNDLTARNNAMKQEIGWLDFHNAALHVLIQHISDAAIVVAADGKVLFINEAYVALLEQGDILLDGDDGQMQGGVSILQARAAQGETFAISGVLRDGSDSPIVLEIEGYPIPGEVNQGGIVIIRRRSQP
jgi:two-component system, chemotaxis family, CheB/CheR fusion protein